MRWYFWELPFNVLKCPENRRQSCHLTENTPFFCGLKSLLQVISNPLQRLTRKDENQYKVIIHSASMNLPVYYYYLFSRPWLLIILPHKIFMPFLPKPVIQTPNNTETIEKMTSFSSVTNQGRPYEQLLHNISGNSTVSWSISNHHSTKHPAEPAVTEIFQ